MGKPKPAVNWWGKALEQLRDRKTASLRQAGLLKEDEEFSRYKLAQLAGIPATQYKAIIHSGVDGPRVATVQSLIKAMEYNWHDWAEACEYVIKAEDTSKKKAKPPPRRQKPSSRAALGA